jgi:hypothetical protein
MDAKEILRRLNRYRERKVGIRDARRGGNKKRKK